MDIEFPLAILAVAMILSFGVGKSSSQVTDKDGNVYKTVFIGTFEWTVENLNVEHYRNGDIIPQVQDSVKWINLKTGAWSYYENNSENEKTYGKLYNWYAVNDPRGLAPEGWHIPTVTEWFIFYNYLYRNDCIGGMLKDTTLWNFPNSGATNETGFTAIPGGCREFTGNFNYFGKICWFWTSSEDEDGNGGYFSMYWNSPCTGIFNMKELYGLSVRCVRN